MAANPRMVNTTVTFTWDGVPARLFKGSIIDVPAGSALETAIGVGNLTTLSAEDTGGDPAGFQPEDAEGGVG